MLSRTITVLFFIFGYLLLATLSFAYSAPIIIKMTSSGFNPQEVSIDLGTTLIFQNLDSEPHWPASDVHPTHDIYPEFDPTRPIPPADSWQFKPDRFGVFKFHDHLNPHVKGVLTILGQQSISNQSQAQTSNIKVEVDRVLSSGVFKLKNPDEDANKYLQDQMDYCFKNGGRDHCYKDLAYILSYQFNLPEILDLLQKNETSEPVFARCHELTHYLTRLAYQKEQNISTIYDQCTSVCHGGCYHGAIEEYLSEKKLPIGDLGQMGQEITKVCGRREDYKVPLLYDECMHGIGHGTMYITDEDLLTSLKLCDLLPLERDRQTCYSGAFMENSSSSTNLDHPSKFIKADDPMYPCDILDKKYLELCYRYQSSHFAIISQSNWTEVARLCSRVPKEYQKFCFLTVGSNQVGFTQDFQKISDDCWLMPTDEAKDFCYQGAVDALAIRYRNDFSKGVEFCGVIDQKFKPGCFKQYGFSVSSWDSDPQSMLRMCESIGNPQFTKWCQGDSGKKPFLAFLDNGIKLLTEKFSLLFARGETAKKKEPDFQSLGQKEQIERLRDVAKTDGVERAWQYLTEVFKTQSGTSGDIHDLAHFVGGLIFEAKGFDGLKVCTPTFAFGCFHGFLDKAFQKDLSDLPKAENGCKMVGPAGSGPYASCIHGIGHGVASFFQASDIKSALMSCDKVSEGKDYCYDGVFMEFARFAPQSFYSSNDPLYPCDSVDEKYVFSCGRNQPNALMQRLGYSFDTVADICSKSQDKNLRDSCATALGFITVAESYGLSDGILANCGRIKDPSSQSQCAISAAGELIFQDFPGWKEEAFKVCNSLGGEAQTSCKNYLQQIIKDYHRI